MSKTLNEQILEISKTLGLPTKKILDLLYYMSVKNEIDNTELITLIGVGKNTLNRVKKEFSDILEPSSAKTVLKKNFYGDTGEIFNHPYQVEENIGDVLNTSATTKLPDRVTPKREYDQFIATLETVNRRAVMIDHFADIEGKNILFLGDDDYTSLAVLQRGKAREIAVIDIDKRVLDGIAKQNPDIKTIKHDLKYLMPPEYLQKYDVVFTDPPYTPEGINLFLSRAVAGLDPNNKAARVYLCYGNSDRAKERFLPVYQAIIAHGLMIRYIFDKFNRYSGAESIGNSSSLFILEATPKTKIIIKGQYEQNVYTNN